MAPFNSFTVEHAAPILFIGVIMLFLSWYAKNRLGRRNRVWLGTSLALITTLSVIATNVISYVTGNWTVQENLPLHLCRLLALVMPWIIYTQNRKWFAITYFMIIVGTMQALLTPDITFGYPHSEYLIYFIFHGVLFFLPIYCIFSFGWKVGWADYFRSIIYLNIYLVLTLIVNFAVGSNYFYTKHKPPGPSLLDLLGPWPTYILVAEFLVLILFALALLPFLRKSKKDKYLF